LSLSSKGPTENAGMCKGDVVVAIGGVPTRHMHVDAAAALCKGDAGTTVSFRIVRGGFHHETFVVTRAKQPTCTPLGLQLALGTDNEKMVARVLPGSPAKSAGLEPGDVILSVDGQTLESTPLSTALQWLYEPNGSDLTIVVHKHQFGHNEFVRIKRTKSQLPGHVQLMRILPDGVRNVAAGAVAVTGGHLRVGDWRFPLTDATLHQDESTIILTLHHRIYALTVPGDHERESLDVLMKCLKAFVPPFENDTPEGKFGVADAKTVLRRWRSRSGQVPRVARVRSLQIIRRSTPVMPLRKRRWTEPICEDADTDAVMLGGEFVEPPADFAAQTP